LLKKKKFAKNKQEFIEEFKTIYHSITSLTNNIKPEKLNYSFDFASEASNFRDIFAIINGWIVLTTKWLIDGVKEDTLVLPLKGYTFKNKDVLAMKFWQSAQKAKFTIVQEILATNYQKCLEAIELTPDKLLFNKKYFWHLKNKSLYFYINKHVYGIFDHYFNIVTKKIKNLTLDQIDELLIKQVNIEIEIPNTSDEMKP